MATQLVDGKLYRIVNSSTFTAVDLLNGGVDDGTPIVGWAANLHDGPDQIQHQIWKLKDHGNGYWVIVNPHDTRTVDMLDGNPQDGNPVVGWVFGGGEHQQWKIERVTPPGAVALWTLKNFTSGTYFDLTGGNSQNGTKIQGLNYLNGVNSPSAWWLFLPLE